MRTLLLFPPPTDPAHPPLGIAALAGYLRAHGEDVSLMDLNIRAYSELLTADFLARCATRLRRRMAGFRRRRGLAAGDLSAYRAVAENILSADWLIERIDGALRRLRDPATYSSRHDYAETTAIVRRAMQFVSAAHHPASWSIGGFVMSRYAMRAADVLAATEDRSENLFIPLFEAVLPEIVALEPDVVGISLNYRMQMIPVMTLASMIRKALPQAFIVAGGGLVSFFEDDWNVLAPFRELVDAWVPFEGEKPLLDLIRTLRVSGDLDGVAGLMRFRDGRAVCGPPASPLPMDDLPSPRFDGLPLHDYLAPEPMVPLLTSRGCYWGRCAFCAHGHLYRAQFRSASAVTVLETMRALSRSCGVNTFYFVDEATQPRMALDLASSIAAEGLPFRWFTEARFERYFNAERLKRIADGGCRMLMFGLESAVPRVLDLMEKGITPELAAQILRDCTAAGIRTYVMFFSGFPTETREEADRTVQFIEQHRRDITMLCGGQFVLEPKSPAYRERERFSITRVYPYPDQDLKTWLQYDVSEGMTLEEAGRVAREIEMLPVIRPPDFHLVSRSHLVFLPHAETSPDDAPAALTPIDHAEGLVPLRRPDLMPERLPFNLDEVQARLRDGSTEPLAPNPTDYVFSPEREALIEVGPDGLALLRACSGDFELADILAAVGEDGRDETMLFLRDLEQRQFISWKASP